MADWRKMKPIRLQKFIADCGVTSRRKAEVLMTEGRVVVNEQVVTELGTKVTPGKDIVQVDGAVIDRDANDKLYILLNKPRAIMSTVSDPEGRRTVIDLCKGIHTRIYPVGRLDYLSEGLMILTNDGDFANSILHPRYEVTKVYEVKVFGQVNENILHKIRDGVKSKGEELKPLSVRVIKQLPTKTWLEFRLVEGKNREIRRICEECDLTIDKLRRVAIGNLSIDGIQPGCFQIVNKSEILRRIGVDKSGKKVEETEYVSQKKSISKKRRMKFRGKGLVADRKEYQIFRKETYNDVVKVIKERDERIRVEKLNLRDMPMPAEKTSEVSEVSSREIKKF